MGQRIVEMLREYISAVYLPKIGLIDLLEIAILTVFIYRIILWIRNTKAWMLLRGILVIVAFIFVAFILQMNTILFLAKNVVTVLATAAIVVFQPELRRALERLGERSLMDIVTPFDRAKETGKFSMATIESILDAVYAMSPVKTGALIVVENATQLTEYEHTGIAIDAYVSSQMLINIFEHNTPLHDGAVIIRGNRIVSATCYLPLSENYRLSKDLGTRHRAAVGMSEVCDALVIVVSEETGAVSVAEGGRLDRSIRREELKTRLLLIQGAEGRPEKKIKEMWKDRVKRNER